MRARLDATSSSSRTDNAEASLGFAYRFGGAIWQSERSPRLLAGSHVLVPRDPLEAADPDADPSTTSRWLWRPLPDMPTPRHHAAACRMGGQIYVTGGIDSSNTASSLVECLDLSTQTWTRKANMLRGRAFHLSLACRGLLYVGGGTPLYERYDPAQNEWAFGTSVYMSDPGFGSGGGLTAVEYDARIYTFGKERHQGFDFVSRAAMYDPSTSVWERFPMPPVEDICHRRYAAVVMGRGCIALLSSCYRPYGHASAALADAVLILCPETRVWAPSRWTLDGIDGHIWSPAMPIPRIQGDAVADTALPPSLRLTRISVHTWSIHYPSCRPL